MSEIEQPPKEETRIRSERRRGKLPPKGTAARAMLAAGLWSHMSREEIEHVKKDIFGSRRSSR